MTLRSVINLFLDIPSTITGKCNVPFVQVLALCATVFPHTSTCFYIRQELFFFFFFYLHFASYLIGLDNQVDLVTTACLFLSYGSYFPTVGHDMSPRCRH